ncbi:MAG: hypothetical protein NVS4B11_13880 [Ktedonobacteraceae bacterium]
MQDEPPKSYRRSTRLQIYDYSQPGLYFVTICVQDRKHVFGTIENGEMRLNDAGHIAQSVWNTLPTRFPFVELDHYVIMPNHIHGIVIITERQLSSHKIFNTASVTGVQNRKNASVSSTTSGAINRAPTDYSLLLGEIIRTFKASTARQIRVSGKTAFEWQRSFHDNIIRDEEALNRIRQYIIDNPALWTKDCFYTHTASTYLEIVSVSSIVDTKKGSTMIGIVPSILSADFTRLGEQVRDAETAGATRIQIDIMDGHFVPNITMGPAIVEAVRSCTKLPLEAHLMITNPEQFVEKFAKAGADIIIVHQEVSPHLHRIVQQIKALGKKAAVALNPSTPIILLEDMLSQLDMVLIMTVNPGFGGQDFIPEMLPKLEKLRQIITERNLICDIEVDGGIHKGTIPHVVKAGANMLVAGSAVYNNHESVEQTIARLKQAIPQ